MPPDQSSRSMLRHRMDEPRDAIFESIPSIEILRRRDDYRWNHVLEPILEDTNGGALPDLGLLEGGIRVLLSELERYRLPEYLVYVNPENRLEVGPLSFTSALVGHRAERLVQACELGANALNSLETGSLQVSAVSSRALLELAIVCWDIHQKLMDPWRTVHGKISRVRAETRASESITFRVLWETRMGTRFYDPGEGWPQAMNIATRISRIGRLLPEVPHIYDLLCDATHPNMESHATLWRTDRRLIGGLDALRFAPGQSNSPVRLAVVESIILSFRLIIPFARDLWWIAADITNCCDMTVNAQTRTLGLPGRTGRNQLCSCGAGELTRECSHPEPHFDFMAEFTSSREC